VLSDPEVDESFGYANRVVIASLHKLNGYSSVRHFVTLKQQIKWPRSARRNDMVCPFLAQITVNNAISSYVAIGI
jgi:hypothetical protein